MSITHVPAWKRLGLKLKYANEVSEPTNAVQPNGHEDSGGPSDSSSTIQRQPPTKKRRLSHETPVNGHPRLTASDPPLHDLTDKPKKRVSFSSDTKLVDGDSAQSALPSEASKLLKQSTTDQSKPKAEKTKSQSKGVSTKSKDSLDYLEQFSTDQNSWKFNKNREIWILKHALSTTDIPPSYNFALAQYIHGLKATNARSRLEAECLEAQRHSSNEANAEGGRDDEKMIRQLRRIVSSQGTVSEEERRSFEGSSRPTLLLIALDPAKTQTATIQQHPKLEETANPSSPIQPASTRNHEEHAQTNTKLQAKKKRKNRTAVIDFSSSSSESSSSSDSESQAATRKSHLNGTKRQKREDDTSSSGESSDEN